MRLIDTEKTIEVLKHLLYETASAHKGEAADMCADIAVYRIDTWVRLVPMAVMEDLEPVVRCKDCKWCDGEELCERHGMVVGLDLEFYCSDGERREDVETD